jgi:hypothetical protein
MASTGIGLSETIIIACAIVAVIVIMLRYIPPPSLERDLEGRIKELSAELLTQAANLAAQGQMVKTLTAQYRTALEEANEAHRLLRLQTQTADQLRQENDELKRSLGTYRNSPMILGVWPFPEIDLDTTVEETAIYNSGFAYRTLRGKEATKEGITLELQRHPYTLLEIGSHGSADGIQLYDDLARPGWWVRLYNLYPHLNTMLLLACESDAIADALVAAGIPIVISLQRPLLDAHVGVFIKNFYRRLVVEGEYSDSIRRAVEFAKNLLPEKSAVLVRIRDRGEGSQDDRRRT